MTAPKDKFAHIAALRPVKPRPRVEVRPAESDSLCTLLGAAPQRNTYGEHLALRRWHDEPQECAAPLDALRLLAPDAPEEAADPREWLFLDTETTGLAGGTGTYAFLVGIAWWDAGGLQVEQFFMRDHGEEHSLLLALAERLAERRVLVTYNGKSFDWPLLETRFRLTRQIRPRAPRAHLDLLHPARQLWRLRLDSLRLSEVERHVLAGERPLAWSRAGDVPGHLIPSIYFDYLRGGSAEAVAAIFRHNQMDLRGLAALAGRMLALAAGPETAADALELYALSRLLERRGQHARARQLYERAIQGGLPRAIGRAARLHLAWLAKRERDYARAASLWQGLVEDGGEDSYGASSLRHSATSLDAFEQLAIYYEHRAGEPDRAAALTREALADLRRALRAGLVEPRRYQSAKARLEHRLARLERKCSGRMKWAAAEGIARRVTRSAAPESNVS
jgi:hypothetical protein